MVVPSAVKVAGLGCLRARCFQGGLGAATQALVNLVSMIEIELCTRGARLGCYLEGRPPLASPAQPGKMARQAAKPSRIGSGTSSPGPTPTGLEDCNVTTAATLAVRPLFVRVEKGMVQRPPRPRQRPRSLRRPARRRPSPTCAPLCSITSRPCSRRSSDCRPSASARQGTTFRQRRLPRRLRKHQFPIAAQPIHR